MIYIVYTWLFYARTFVAIIVMSGHNLHWAHATVDPDKSVDKSLSAGFRSNRAGDARMAPAHNILQLLLWDRFRDTSLVLSASSSRNTEARFTHYLWIHNPNYAKIHVAFTPKKTHLTKTDAIRSQFGTFHDYHALVRWDHCYRIEIRAKLYFTSLQSWAYELFVALVPDCFPCRSLG